MGFISKIYKRLCIKRDTDRSATSADAADFGLGLLTEIADNTKTSDINENEQDDLGRGLFDVGQVVELVSFSNINADIRSIEVFSPEDSLMYGGIEIFILTRRMFFGDSRPDSTGYNHGYTGDVNPVSYSRQKTLLHITLSFLTEFFCQKETRRKGFSMPSETSRDLITGITV
jgi:hypothetical protein